MCNQLSHLESELSWLCIQLSHLESQLSWWLCIQLSHMESQLECWQPASCHRFFTAFSVSGSLSEVIRYFCMCYCTVLPGLSCSVTVRFDDQRRKLSILIWFRPAGSFPVNFLTLNVLSSWSCYLGPPFFTWRTVQKWVLEYLTSILCACQNDSGLLITQVLWKMPEVSKLQTLTSCS